MDLKWVNEFYSGCAITINIKFNKGICQDQCGLATSSRKWAAKVWNGSVPNYLKPLQAARPSPFPNRPPHAYVSGATVLSCWPCGPLWKRALVLEDQVSQDYAR